MNLLHVHSGNMFGGVERMLETLAPAYAGERPIHSCYALCFEGRTAETLERAGGAVHHLGPVRSRRVDEIWRARRALKGVLADGSWDAVCVHSAWSQGIFGPTVLKSGAPLVRWLHAPEPGPRWMEVWSARSRPSLVICNSDYTRRASGARLGSVPVVVTHPPARPLASRPNARAMIRERLGTPRDAVVILVTARIERGKGHDLLLDSLETLPRVPWEAWIVGGPQRAAEDAYMKELRAKCADLTGRVHFAGDQPDVGDWMAAADIYCQPNRSPDSFGLAFVEALAAGLPVITTRLGAAPEIVDGSCGILIAPASAAELTGALRSLVENPAVRQRMAAAARERARNFSDLDRSVTRLADALRAVTAPSLSLT